MIKDTPFFNDILGDDKLGLLYQAELWLAELPFMSLKSWGLNFQYFRKTEKTEENVYFSVLQIFEW